MSYDFERLLHDHGIDCEGANSRGFVTLSCPFCGDSGRRGGFNVNESYYTCWLCGWHGLNDVVTALGIQGWSKIRSRYESGSSKREKAHTEVAAACVLPPGTQPLKYRHKKYLRERGFKPHEIVETWGIMGTPHVGEWKNRIIIPIHYKGEIVSYQGRDITGKSSLRYRTCSKSDEKIFHKKIVYGYDYIRNSHPVVCEGVTDVWRLGQGAVATFGTSWSREQVLLLSKFRQATIIYDAEADAQRRAIAIAAELSGLGVDADTVMLRRGDPGRLDDETAKAIMAEILGE
jgi:hypothetical protein